MTLIIGLHEADYVYIAGDHARTSTVDGTVSMGQKVFKHYGLVVGCAGSVATMNVIEHELKSLPATSINLNDATLNAWVGRLRDIIETLGKQGNPTIPSAFWFSALLGLGKELVYIDNREGWQRITDEFRCIGSGALPGTACMHVFAPTEGEVSTVSATDRFANAFSAVSKTISGVSSTHTVERT